MSNVQIPKWVTEGIAEVQQPIPASPSRYPYTYAYDYLRRHKAEFGVPSDVDSRADIGMWIRKRLGVDDPDPLVEAVCRKLADAHLAETNEVL